MELINDNNFKMSLDTQYNHTLNHSFGMVIDGELHSVCCDAFAECYEDGTVKEFYVSCIEDDFYTDDQLEEIDEFLTIKLNKYV